MDNNLLFNFKLIFAIIYEFLFNNNNNNKQYLH